MRDWRNVVIGALAIAVAALAMLLLRDRLPRQGGAASVKRGEPISVIDVVLERSSMRALDVLFDKPLGANRVGEVLGRDPGTIEPKVGGFWRWQSGNVLRFEAPQRFAMATEYRLVLRPERLLAPGQFLDGKSKFVVKTDQFRIEAVDVREEQAPEGEGKVVLHGDLRFNYGVDPKVLASKIRLQDPVLEESATVAVTFEGEYWSESISFRTAPIEKQKKERELTLTILSDLTPVEGNVSLAADYTKKIPLGSRDRLGIRDASATPGEPDSVIRIALSSSVDPAVAQKYVHVEPEVAVRFGIERSDLLLTGPFRPGETYTLTVDEGLPARDGATLRKKFEKKLPLPDMPAALEFESEGMFLSASGARALALQSVNVDSFDLVIDRVYRNNVFYLFENFGWSAWREQYFNDSVQRSMGDRIASESIAIHGEKNKKARTAVALDRFLKGKEPGLYRVGITRQAGEWGKQRWLLITDLGVVAKRAEDEFLVWVASFANLGNVAGATVRLVSEQNQTIAEGKTDERGLWRVPGLQKLLKKDVPDETREPYMVLVTRGEDMSFLILDRSTIDASSFDVSGAPATKAGYSAFLYGERDIVRPGETVKGVAVIRDRKLSLPPKMPVNLRHRDPEGRERAMLRRESDADGLVPFELEMPAYARTGHHTLELVVAEEVIGQYRFQVEEFVPDRIKVEIKPEKPAFKAGEEVVYDVSSAYLFGAPSAGLPVETRVRLLRSNFSAKGYEAFSFENPGRKFDDRELTSETGELDENGGKRFTVGVPSGLEPPSALEAVLTARVREQGGRGVAAMQRVRVHPFASYVGLRRTESEGYAEPGARVAFEFVRVTPDGKEVAGGKLRAELWRDRWQTVLRRTASGSFRYESTRDPSLVDAQAIETGAARGGFVFTPREFGAHRIVVTDLDTKASAEIEITVAGGGYSPWAIKDPSRIELTLDKEEYAPGETAKLQVRAPFAGTLLVSIERDRIERVEVHEMSGNTATISLPVDAALRPNAYVTATLVRRAADLEPGGAGRAFGAVPISVDRLANRLNVVVRAPELMRPNGPLAIDVEAAPNAIVTVAAVDEGILQLVAHKTPDPFAFFYQKLALGVQSFDIFALLLPEVKGAATPGGGDAMGDLAQFVRTEGIRRTKPVAFWSGVVRADASGKARVEFTIPEFQGAVRTMAVAIAGDRFGSADETTRIKDPIVVLPTFPRILSFGETIEVPVTVRNDTGKDGAFEVALGVEGAKLVGEPQQKIELAKGKERTVVFSVETGNEPGDVSFAVTASGNEEKTKATGIVGVRADLPPHTIERAGRLEEGETSFALEAARQFRDGTVRRKLQVGGTPLIRFAGKLRHLLHYPYGCTEQVVSQVFPLIHLAELARTLDPELFAKGDPAAMVQEGIQRVRTTQLDGGGFSLWPDSSNLHAWTSVYATHFLTEAKRAGYAVDDVVLTKAIDFVAGDAKAKESYGQDELERAVYALYVLARVGKADLGTMDFIRAKHGKELRPDSRALLAAAYAQSGNRKALDDLIKNIDDADRVKRSTGFNFSSTIRGRALLLLAFLDVAPKDPRVAKLVQRLARDAEFGGWTTQESAFTLLALGQFQREQSAKGPFKGTVLVGDRQIGHFSNEKPATFGGIEGAEPIRIVLDEKSDPEAVFYSLETRGIPTDAAYQPESAGLELGREYLTRAGAPLDLANVAQGDLVVTRLRIRSVSGRLDNVVIENLLPSGLEVENPRLQSSETLPWIGDADLSTAHVDFRDDRVLVFADLGDNSWRTAYVLLRAVTPGKFRLPPVQAEAMYDPAIRARGERATMDVRRR